MPRRPAAARRGPDDDVRAVGREGVGLADAVDADDPAEATGAAGLHPGQRVLEDGRVRGLHAEAPGALEEGVRGRLALQALVLDRVAVHDGVGQVRQPGGGQDVLRVRARRHDRHRQPGVAGGAGEAHGALVRLDAVVVDRALDEVVLPPSQAVHGVRVGGVVGRALGEVDRARGQEGAHPVEPRLAVDVLGVVAHGVEGRLPARGQDGVEHLLPRLGVDLRGLRQHPVEVEQQRADPVGKAEHDVSLCPLGSGRDGGLERLERRRLAPGAPGGGLRAPRRR